MNKATVAQPADTANAFMAFAADVLARGAKTPVIDLPTLLGDVIKPIHKVARVAERTVITLSHSVDGHGSLTIILSSGRTSARIYHGRGVVAHADIDHAGRLTLEPDPWLRRQLDSLGK